MEILGRLLLPPLQASSDKMNVRDSVLSMPGVRSGATVEFRRRLLSAAISAKWQVDRLRLPLTEDHRELYDIIHRAYWRRLQDFPHLVRCRGVNDKIQWLKLFDQRQESIQCADKLAVRDYVSKRVGREVLVPILQVCDSFEQIDFAGLPKSFVIKVNSDSGNVVLVRDKASMDMEKARERINFALNRVYAWNEGEWAYAFIAPKILIEEFLEPEQPVPPPDYKFHCVNGKIRWLQYLFDRGAQQKEAIVDPQGNLTDLQFSFEVKHAPRFTKPAEWPELCRTAEALAEGWKYVRVDLYLVRGAVKFSEVTMHPMSGFFIDKGQERFGKLLDFDRGTYLPPIYRRMPRAPRPE